MKEYVGNLLQIRGVEQYTLQNGRGYGMRFLYVRNGLGLDIWISLDRAGDVSRVQFKGNNIGYFSPCGYVSPQYYDAVETGFLKSFTAGFFTTCGLTAVGSPCTDMGERLPLHGNVSHIPAELIALDESGDGLTIKLMIRDAVLFGRKLVLNRSYHISYTENSFEVSDTVTNEADMATPYMILYHCNIGYPLLHEDSIVKIPNSKVVARNDHAEESISSALKMECPQQGYEECCYYYDVMCENRQAHVGIYNSEIKTGLVMTYDNKALPYFTEWKMMGKTDYVLGLEPGNCLPDGRDVMRQTGKLAFLEPDQSGTTGVKFTFMTNAQDFGGYFEC